jgi:hypothetical protein
MKFSVSAIKTALTDAGHEISDAAHLTASDLEQLYDFAMRKFGIKKQTVAYGLQYPSVLPKDFPGHPDAGEVEAPAAGSQPAATLPSGTDEPAPVTQAAAVVASTPEQTNTTLPAGTSEPAAAGTPAVATPATETTPPVTEQATETPASEQTSEQTSTEQTDASKQESTEQTEQAKS